MSRRFSNTPEPVERHILKEFWGNVKAEYDFSTLFEIVAHNSARFSVQLLNSKIWVTKSEDADRSVLLVQETYAKQMGLV